jgi:hypothetical protein
VNRVGNLGRRILPFKLGSVERRRAYRYLRQGKKRIHISTRVAERILLVIEKGDTSRGILKVTGGTGGGGTLSKI